jgi:hypothetical protein
MMNSFTRHKSALDTLQIGRVEERQSRRHLESITRKRLLRLGFRIEKSRKKSERDHPYIIFHNDPHHYNTVAFWNWEKSCGVSLGGLVRFYDYIKFEDFWPFNKNPFKLKY